MECSIPSPDDVTYELTITGTVWSDTSLEDELGVIRFCADGSGIMGVTLNGREVWTFFRWRIA